MKNLWKSGVTLPDMQLDLGKMERIATGCHSDKGDVGDFGRYA